MMPIIDMSHNNKYKFWEDVKILIHPTVINNYYNNDNHNENRQSHLYNQQPFNITLLYVIDTYDIIQ